MKYVIWICILVVICLLCLKNFYPLLNMYLTYYTVYYMLYVFWIGLLYILYRYGIIKLRCEWVRGVQISNPSELDFAEVRRHCSIDQAGNLMLNFLQLPFKMNSSTSPKLIRESRRSILPFTSHDLNSQSHTWKRKITFKVPKFVHVLLPWKSHLHWSILLNSPFQTSGLLQGVFWILWTIPPVFEINMSSSMV